MLFGINQPVKLTLKGIGVIMKSELLSTDGWDIGVTGFEKVWRSAE